MSTFWSWYVTALTIGTLLALLWLVFATRKGEKKGETEQTMGHSFDGIEEYDNPLPKWWFMLFVGTIIFAVVYLVLYPGWGNWKGILPGYAYLDNDKQAEFSDGQAGWSGVHEWEKEMAKADARFGPIFAKFAAMPIEEVAKDPQALKMGGRLFAFVGEAPVMKARLITCEAEGRFRTEDIFETVVPMLKNAPQRDGFSF